MLSLSRRSKRSSKRFTTLIQGMSYIMKLLEECTFTPKINRNWDDTTSKLYESQSESTFSIRSQMPKEKVFENLYIDAETKRHKRKLVTLEKQL